MVRCASGIELRLIRPDLEKAELERNVVYILESRQADVTCYTTRGFDSHIPWTS